MSLIYSITITGIQIGTQRCSSNAVGYPGYPEQLSLELLLLELQNEESEQSCYPCIKNIYCPFEFNLSASWNQL